MLRYASITPALLNLIYTRFFCPLGTVETSCELNTDI